MSKRIFIVLGLALVAFLALTGFRGYGHHGGDPSQKIERMLQGVNLTDAQRVQVDKVENDLRAKAETMKAQRGQMHQQLISFWNQENPDPAAVHAEVDHRIDAMRGFAHQMADSFLQIHQILTPEQRQEVAAHLEHHKE